MLDEPFSGLDPVNAHIIKKVLQMLVNNGTYIIMSAHQMYIIEEFCQDILILDKGYSVLRGNLDEIKNSYRNQHAIIRTYADISNLIPAHITVSERTSDTYKINFSHIDEANSLLGILLNNNIQIEKFEIIKPSLEEIFVEKVGKIK